MTRCLLYLIDWHAGQLPEVACHTLALASIFTHLMSDQEVCLDQSLRDGKFCGLALDQDNEDDKTDDRIKGWVAQLKSEGF